VEQKFELKQTVLIKGNGKNGQVISVWTSICGLTRYEVRYFDDVNRDKESWFVASELESVA